MTEAEWLTCNEPKPMLEFLRRKTGERKLRLFAVACCRRLWHYPLEKMDDSEGASWVRPFREAIGIGEKLADGRATAEELATVKYLDGNGVEILDAFRGCVDLTDDLLPEVSQNTIWAVDEWAFAGYLPLSHAADQTPEQAEKAAHSDLLREIFGNPFRPVSIKPAWLTPTVSNLATVAYEERVLPSGELDPARLAVLADALEEAGCDNADILNHLRSPGPHVRGCWPVDLLTGRE